MPKRIGTDVVLSSIFGALLLHLYRPTVSLGPLLACHGSNSVQGLRLACAFGPRKRRKLLHVAWGGVRGVVSIILLKKD